MIEQHAAACRYLQDAHDRYGDWTLAAASYNSGHGRGGQTASTGRRTRTTTTCSFRRKRARTCSGILAASEILPSGALWIPHPAQDLYPPYRTRVVRIEGSVDDLADLAIRNGTDYRTLKLLNPWLRDVRLANREGRAYDVLLPR